MQNLVLKIASTDQPKKREKKEKKRRKDREKEEKIIIKPNHQKDPTKANVTYDMRHEFAVRPHHAGSHQV